MSLRKLRQNRGVQVPARSKEEINGLANAFRLRFARNDLSQKLDIVELIEVTLPRITNLKFEFEIIDKETMGKAEAAMAPDMMRMFIREDVYERLHENDARARFTIAHEIGHFVLHDGVALTRSNNNQHEVFRDSEWQADCFAAELLAPIEACKRHSTIKSIMDNFGVSRSCAKIRFNEIKN